MSTTAETPEATPAPISPLAAVGGGLPSEAAAQPTGVIQPTASFEGVATLDEWKAAKAHVITVPSGVKLAIAIPDLPGLVKEGGIPNELVNIAIGLVKGEEITADDIVKQADFYNRLVAISVISPKVTEEQVASGILPTEDKEMIVELATRQRDVDAVGHHLAGLEKVKDWRTFRGVSHVYEDVEGA